MRNIVYATLMVLASGCSAGQSPQMVVNPQNGVDGGESPDLGHGSAVDMDKPVSHADMLPAQHDMDPALPTIGQPCSPYKNDAGMDVSPSNQTPDTCSSGTGPTVSCWGSNSITYTNGTVLAPLPNTCCEMTTYFCKNVSLGVDCSFNVFNCGGGFAYDTLDASCAQTVGVSPTTGLPETPGCTAG